MGLVQWNMVDQDKIEDEFGKQSEVSRAVKQAMRQDDEKLKADLNRMMACLKHEVSDTDHEATRRHNLVEQANENKTCVPPGLDLSDLHSIPDPVICGRCEVFPARFVLKISHNVSCRVVSDVLPKL